MIGINTTCAFDVWLTESSSKDFLRFDISSSSRIMALSLFSNLRSLALFHTATHTLDYSQGCKTNDCIFTKQNVLFS
jgi:hypothetical protein